MAETDNVYDFGIRIKELRERKGMSQGKLAQRLDIEPSTVSAYERNIRTPSLEVFINLVIILDTTANYLLGFDNKNILTFNDVDEKQTQFLIKIKDSLIEYDGTKKTD